MVDPVINPRGQVAAVDESRPRQHFINVLYLASRDQLSSQLTRYRLVAQSPCVETTQLFAQRGL
eukprot:2161440-Lingulodinium_polyedra.AAC.1